MLHKLYFYTLILSAFTSCGNGTSDNKQQINNRETIEDIPITCIQEATTKNLNKAYYKKPIPFETPNNLKLLLADKPLVEKTTFDHQGLYALFQTEYFWAEETKKNLNISKYTDPQKLIDDLKYQDDRWSFAVTPKLYNDAISQKSIGFGFSCHDIATGCLITYVRIDSPADKMDFRRGDIIQKIDNQITSQELIYTKGQEEKVIKFELSRPNSNERCSGKLLPREYSYKVVKSKILKMNLRLCLIRVPNLK